MRRSVICGAFLVALAVSMPVAAAPITIVDTGPGPQVHNGWTLNPGWSWANEFVVTSAVTITSMEAWMSVGGMGWLDIGIYRDDVTTGGPGVPGQIPGTELFTDSVKVPSTASATWLGVTGVSHTLLPGTYWIVVSSQPGMYVGTWAILPNPSTHPLPNGATNYGGGTWYPYDAAQLGVRISGTDAVPDLGSSLLLFGIGASCLAALRRRFR